MSSPRRPARPRRSTGAGYRRARHLGDGSRIVVGKLVSEDGGAQLLAPLHECRRLRPDDRSDARHDRGRPLRRHDRRRLEGLLHHDRHSLLRTDTDNSADIYSAEVDGGSGTDSQLVSTGTEGPATPTPAIPRQHDQSDTGTRSAPKKLRVVAVGGGGGVARSRRHDLLPLAGAARRRGERRPERPQPLRARPGIGAALRRDPRVELQRPLPRPGTRSTGLRRGDSESRPGSRSITPTATSTCSTSGPVGVPATCYKFDSAGPPGVRASAATAN